MAGKNDSLPDEIIIEALGRYQQGEAMADIARDLKTSYGRLWRATEAGRKVLGGQQRAISPEIIDMAIDRWRGGETLTAIARDMQVNYVQLTLATAAYGRPKRRQRLPVPDPLMMQALQRYEQGEPLKAIARDMEVDYQHLRKQMLDYRKGLPPKQPAILLSEQDMQTALVRWKEGETLKAIAGDLGVKLDYLTKATVALRNQMQRPSRKKPPQPLSLEVIERAVQQWQQGKSVASIAKSMNVPYTELVRATASARQPRMKRAPVPVTKLSAAIIADVRARRANGESLTDIATELGIPFKELYGQVAPSKRRKHH